MRESIDITSEGISEVSGGGKRKLWVWVIIGVVAAAVIGTSIGLAVHFTSGSSESEPGPVDVAREQSKIDCFLEDKWGTTEVTQKLCEDRGCTYEVSRLQEEGIPDCFMGNDSQMGLGYTADLVSDTEDGLELDLEPNSARMKNEERPGTLLSPVPVKLSVQYHGPDIVRIKLSHKDAVRYEVPDRITHLNLPENQGDRRYTVQYTEAPRFHFSVVRDDTDTLLWDTSVGGLVISDQFLSISTRLPSSNVYGFGENSHDSFRHDLDHTSWGMFARDQWVGTGIHNHYGVHPFYTCLENDGNSHGVLILNSNAMDYTFTTLPMLTFRTVGGVLDLLFFLGSSPESVIQQYTEVIGRPYLVPYWSLGFQLCRYGYNSLTKLQEAVNRTRDAGIPQDVQYADIDHYDERKVFTVDNEAFAGLPEYFDYLRSEGLRTIIILDPCLIINETNYEPFELSRAIDGNIKWLSKDAMPEEDFLETNSTDMLGFVWPKGKVVFPDFFVDETEQLWSDLIVQHYDTIRFDGLWIDMNEPANFGTNEDRPWNWPEDDKPYWSLECPSGGLEDPTYRTMASFVYDEEMTDEHGRLARLSDKTLCMTAKQGREQYDHYDVHSLYGASQIRSTLSGLRNSTRGERGIVVSRSTFPGSGKDSGHWLGDNFSEWPHLKDSIIGMLEFNLFGIPYIGADICGFFGDTTAQMCMRWQQLGAFYPYSRNHNQIDSPIDQDPANFDELTTAMSREAMLIRYELLPYLYTLFYEAHTKGNTVVRPVFHEFRYDDNTWGIDEQFMWGPALLISPILFEDQTELTYYLPEGVWYDFYTGEVSHSDPASGEHYTIPIQLNSSIPLHMRGGHIIPTQEPAMNTFLSRENPFHMKAYLNERSEAYGDMFWDDGVGIDTIEDDAFQVFKMSCEKNEFIMRQDGKVADMPLLSSVYVFGVGEEPVSVTVDGNDHTNYTYQSQVLHVENLDKAMADDLNLTWNLP